MRNKNLGWVFGFIGVFIFSGSLPATKLAVQSFDPLFLTGVRAVIAACAAVTCLILYKQLNCKQLTGQKIRSLSIVAIGVVVGFPLFTALALETIDSAHAIVFVGLLPLSTALFGVLRAKEKTTFKFWLFALLGASFVVGFMLNQNQNLHMKLGDLYMLIAIVLCGLGYAEGAVLTKSLTSWSVICWALILASPVMLGVMLYDFPQNWNDVSAGSIWALIYVSLFSMLIGFFFWYKGLSLGGVAEVGQIQLIQPFFGFALSAWLLSEPVNISMLITSIAVICCVILAKRYAS